MTAPTIKHTSMKVGVSNLCFATLLTDTGEADPTYDAVVKTKGLMNVGLNPNASMDSAFYDDGPNETATTLGKLEIELEKSSLSTSELAYLLGHQLDTNGCLIEGGSDVAPYVAMGFQALHSDGTSEYVWVYKVKFMDPESKYETKGDSIAFQSETIKGIAVKVNREFTVNGKKVVPWRIKAEEADNSVADSKVFAQWFNKPVLPNMTLTA